MGQKRRMCRAQKPHAALCPVVRTGFRQGGCQLVQERRCALGACRLGLTRDSILHASELGDSSPHTPQRTKRTRLISPITRGEAQQQPWGLTRLGDCVIARGGGQVNESEASRQALSSTPRRNLFTPCGESECGNVGMRRGSCATILISIFVMRAFFFHLEQRKLFARNFTHLQILARMSPLPVAKTPPVGLGATEITVTPRRHNVSFFHDFQV